MSETKTETSGAETKRPKKKIFKLIILVFLLLALVGGGAAGGYFYFGARKDKEEATETKDEKGKKDDQEGGSEPAKHGDTQVAGVIPNDEAVKTVVELPPFIVNLADAEQARYLRMTVSVGIGGEEGGEKPSELFMTRVRNVLLAVLSEKKSEDVLTVEGKAKLRKELLEAAQAASEEPHVEAIYITDFIVQL